MASKFEFENLQPRDCCGSVADLANAYKKYGREHVNNVQDDDDITGDLIRVVDLLLFEIKPRKDIFKAYQLMIDNKCNLNQCGDTRGVIFNLIHTLAKNASTQQQFERGLEEYGMYFDFLVSKGATLEADVQALVDCVDYILTENFCKYNIFDEKRYRMLMKNKDQLKNEDNRNSDIYLNIHANNRNSRCDNYKNEKKTTSA